MSGFDEVLPMLKQGAKIRRTGWNGKGMYLELQVPDANSKMTLPYIYLVTPNERGACHPNPQYEGIAYDRVPWLASQTDILAQDWQYDDGTPAHTYSDEQLRAALSGTHPVDQGAAYQELRLRREALAKRNEQRLREAFGEGST